MGKNEIKPRQVTRKELEQFIASQPDDREVNFDQCRGEQWPGCVMVQFGREVLGLQDFSCTGRRWFRPNRKGGIYRYLAEIDAKDRNLQYIDFMPDRSCTTYAAVKERYNERRKMYELSDEAEST